MPGREGEREAVSGGPLRNATGEREREPTKPSSEREITAERREAYFSPETRRRRHR